MEPLEEEKQIGLEVFYTETSGIGGRIRYQADDFRVTEVPYNIRRDDNGNYVILEVTAKNWETNHLIRELSKRLRISRKRIGFAGTKDKRGVTTQLISIYYPDELPEIKLKDVDIKVICRASKGIDIGDLKGNLFEIKIRDVEGDIEEICTKIESIYGKLQEIRGFPNFYGLQRFGGVRLVTHLVGKYIIMGRFDKAVETYLTLTSDIESDENREARRRFAKDKNVSEALKYFPRHLSFELALLNELRKGEDPLVALQSLPRNLLLMFVYAYQSYIFNRIISERIRRGLPIGEAIPGDIVIPISKYGEEDNLIPVTERNLDKVNRAISKGKAAVSAVLIGYDCRFADGEMGEIEQRIVEDEKINLKDFVVPEIPALSSAGGRRPIIAHIEKFNWKCYEDEIIDERFVVEMSFFLKKGSYATSLLREFMKAKDIKAYLGLL
ncbi:MAG TPA: tRNA pseudouridine(13) synthase TruD [Thermoplasmatales archaeon]|nr:tRNA pseudouridine(13) synthase TruD [Thermoplasmatales archaeon]